VANRAKFAADFELEANKAKIDVADEMSLAAKISDGARLYVKAAGNLTLGAEQSAWNLCVIRAVAKSLHIETGHAIWTEDSSIADNKPVPNEDVCTATLAAAESIEKFRKHMDTKENRLVYFDAAIVAFDDVYLHKQSRLWVAGLLLCAGKSAEIEPGVLLKTSGRGQGPGRGPATGETLLNDVCGAGGASSFALGGSGVEYTASCLKVCAKSGWVTRFTYGSSIPTAAASGGGCGVETEKCNRLQRDKQHPSAGGGLIWISADTLHTVDDVHMSADGNAGALVEDGDGVSGGGAGGQIIMFLRALKVEHALVLSAQGGNAECDTDKNIASGAGAGGFVGISWRNEMIEQPSAGVRVGVGGGDLELDCEQFVPEGQEGRSDILGSPGIAASLTHCLPGRAGVFCEKCPAGTWIDGGLQCIACTNKPALRAEYTMSGWATSNCPYNCTNGVAPDCFCPAGSVGVGCELCEVGTWSAFGGETCEACMNKPGGNSSAYTTEGWHDENCPYKCRVELMDNETCKCPAGYAGAECAECPVGMWSERGSERCQECRNKPGRWSKYSTAKWATPDCPYRCSSGVPSVDINPGCDCPAGYAGKFCTSCPVGKWSALNSLHCLPCANKPGPFSEYIDKAWPNSSCAFQCTSDVFDVSDNPRCLSPVAYAVEFYGGTPKMLCFFFISFLIGLILLCFNRRRPPLDRATPGDRAGLFVHERLPYHLCRIYLRGQNSQRSSWSLGSGSVPEVLQELVHQRVWDNFSAEFNWYAQVDISEKCLSRLLSAVHPYRSLQRRRRRAENLRRLVQQRSEGEGKAAIWNEQKGKHLPQMIFTCDDGATLGYLDFFDSSLEEYDWTPVDLRREARFLLAHGLGTSLDPFSLDVGDPLVEQLALTDFGAEAVHNVVLTFNRFARLVSKRELRADAENILGLQMLEAEVAKCATAVCFPEGVVRVCLLPQDRGPQQRWQDSQLHRDVSVMESTFSDMVRRLPPSNSSTMGCSEGGFSPQGELAGAQMAQEMRLCLLFLDSTEALEGDAIRYKTQDSRCANGAAPLCAEGRLEMEAQPEPPMPGHLTSPMTHAVASSLALSVDHFSSIAAAEQGGALPRLAIWRLTMLRWESAPCAAMQAMASVLAMPLLLLDTMVGLLFLEVLFRKGTRFVTVFLLTPPLAPIFASATGFAFLVLDRPRLGRLHKTLVAWSAVNVVVACFLMASYHSFLMLLKELPLVCFCKFALFVCAEIRIFWFEDRNDVLRSTRHRDFDTVDAADAASFRAILRDLSSRFSARPSMSGPSLLRARVAKRARTTSGGISLTAASSWTNEEQVFSRAAASIISQSSESSLRLTFVHHSPNYRENKDTFAPNKDLTPGFSNVGARGSFPAGSRDHLPTTTESFGA